MSGLDRRNAITVRGHLEAIRDLVKDDPLRDHAAWRHAVAAIQSIDDCNVPDTWKAEGQGAQSAHYRCRILPDPRPGEPHPWVSS